MKITYKGLSSLLNQYNHENRKSIHQRGSLQRKVLDSHLYWLYAVYGLYAWINIGMIPRYIIFIKEIISGIEQVHPRIFYDKFDAKVAIDDLPFSRAYYDIQIKILW